MKTPDSILIHPRLKPPRTRGVHRYLTCLGGVLQRATAALLFIGGLVPSPTAQPAASEPRVYRDRIEPHWFANNDRFWYRNDLRDGAREFVLLNAASGERKAAFDHERLAQALSRISGTSIRSDRLPIESLEFDESGSSVLLRGATNGWRLDLDSYEINLAPEARAELPALTALPESRPSRRTGPESEILFVNRLDEKVELYWIDPEGNRHSYGTLAAGEERRQHTFAGHVWLVTRQGTVVGVFEAEEAPSRAEIPSRGGARSRGGRRGGRPGPSVQASVAPSPDGRFEAFVRDHNLWLRDTGNGKESPLSFDANPGHTFRKNASRERLIGMQYERPDPPPTLPEVFWSPDAKHLVALQTRVVPERRVVLVESSPRDQLQPRELSYPYLKAGDEIPVQRPRLFDLASQREVPFPTDSFPNPWDLSEFRWTSNSTRFTFVYNQRGHQVLRLISVDADTGAVQTVIDEQSATVIDYSSKFLCDWVSDDEVLWMSERDGWNHLYLYEVPGGRMTAQVTHGNWSVRSVERLDQERRTVLFRAVGIRPEQDPYHFHFARVNLDGNDLEMLTEGDGTHSLQWSPDRRRFIDTWSRVDHPPEIELRDAETGRKLCSLEQADAEDVLQARGRFPERFVAKGRDGATDIYGIIHRPKDFDPARRYPVIENIYAGPHDFHVPKSFRAGYRHQQQIADRGFIVVQIDGMGTSWRSRAFHDVAWRNLRDAGFPDRIAWMKAAAQQFPEMDLTRVGIYGGSAGGQNAMAALLWHGDFYRVAVADCGCHDNRMDKIWWSEQWMGWPVGPHYAENSNAVNAHLLQGKLLLLVGELDKNVDPSSTLQVVHALQQAGKDFEFQMIMGAGHGSAETPYGSRRRLDFFVDNLLSPPH